MSPIEAVTFLEEDNNENMTEDWHKSLLYSNIKTGVESKFPFTYQEMTVLSHKPPRDQKGISVIIEKGLMMLQLMLIEMLGTREDMERFEERYKVLSPGHVRALMKKCLSLFNVRKITEEILRLIVEREDVMKSLESSVNNVKEKVLKVYKLNKNIREKIVQWTKEEFVPFEAFTFKGKDYLAKISEDSVVLQNYLSSPFVLYTWC